MLECVTACVKGMKRLCVDNNYSDCNNQLILHWLHQLTWCNLSAALCGFQEPGYGLIC